MLLTGKVIFNPNSSANINDSVNSGIKNVPIILQNINTKVGLIVLTDENGTFKFENVPSGSYQVVESANMKNGALTPGNFNNASLIEKLIPSDPDINYVNNAPKDATNLVSLSPNTVFINIIDSDINDIIFLDSPIKKIPLELNDYITIGDNLISEIDNGTWGNLPAGTSVQTSPSSTPYPNIGTVFKYVQYGNSNVHDGDYTVTNITNNNSFDYTWWNLSIGDETNRFAIINGNYPGKPFFKQKICKVKPNTKYLFLTWLCNIDTDPSKVLPQLGIQITDASDNVVLYKETLNDTFPVTNIPTWHQVGDIIDTGDNDSITVTFLSEGPAAAGNDFAISYIDLKELEPSPVTSIVKSVDKSFASPGDTLTYTIVLKNEGPATIDNAIFIDPTPYETSLIKDSLTLNGFPSKWNLDNTTFTLGSLKAGKEIVVKYSVIINKGIELGNKIYNSSRVYYNFIDSYGILRNNHIKSNTVETNINAAILTSHKVVDKTSAFVGDFLTYNITISNIGNVTAENVIFKDNISSNVEFINNSLTINGINISENPTISPVNIGYIYSNSSALISFKVKIDRHNSENIISNFSVSDYIYKVSKNSTNPKSSTSVSNTTQTIILNCITCPEGPQGKQGIPGVTGPTGPRGATGVCSCNNITSVYSQFSLLCEGYFSKCHTLPLRYVFTNNNDIKLNRYNNQIIVTPFYTYMINWSITFTTCYSNYNVKAGISIDNTFINSSIAKAKGCSYEGAIITINGSSLFEAFPSTTNLSLRILDLDFFTINIINASVSIFSIDHI